MPFFTTPFLVRMIGIDLFGTIAFIKAIAFYFMIVKDWGFNYSATHQISIAKQDPKKIHTIIWNVFAIKTIFLFFGIAALLAAITYVPTIHAVKTPFLCYFPAIIASTFFPLFVFQGLEKLKSMAIISATSKGLFLIALVSLVRSRDDYLLYPILLSCTACVRLFIALIYMARITKLRFVRPSFKEMLFQLQDGFSIFTSMLSISIYSRLPTVLLGFFCGTTAVGIYNSSIRIVRSTLGMIEPLTQSLFPLASRKIHQQASAGISYVLQCLKYSCIVAGSLGVLYFAFAPSILLFMTGKILPQALPILRLHSLLPLIIVISNIVGIHLLIPIGKRNYYSLTMTATAIVAGCLLPILIPYYQAFGAALAIFISECFATICMIGWFLYFLNKKRSSQIKIPL